MKWNFTDDRAIYAQIMDQVKLFILSGELPPGGRLPSVRELAAEAGVNPNTMQRALTELESTGLLISQRTQGRFVTDDSDLIFLLKRETARNRIAGFIGDMSKIGYSTEETKNLINIYTEEKSDE